MKFASSAANITGKPLVSSESTTWLGDHFSVSLSQIKPQIDELFTAGINHVFFHGTTYSPYWKGFPGRLFYASTHYGHTSHFWEELPALTQYIETCQHILQNSSADNDILLYFPIYDIWGTLQEKNIIKMLDVHYLSRGLKEYPFGQTADWLWQAGYTFDYISDRMLRELPIEPGKVIVVPHTERMPVETLEALLHHVQKGIPIVFLDAIPTDVPGVFQYQERTKLLKEVGEKVKPFSRITTVNLLKSVLAEQGVLPEPFKARGIDFIRKQQKGRKVFFLTNLSANSGERWIPLNQSGDAIFFDSESKKIGRAAERIRNGVKEIRLQLPPGESLFLFIYADKAESVEAWNYFDKDSESDSLLLEGDWFLVFKKGVPDIRQTVSILTWNGWTTLGEPYDIFSGKLAYTSSFALDPEQLQKRYVLELGDVRETAKVTINGQSLPLCWHVPFSLIIPEGVLQEENTIKIEVTNLSYNRVIVLDRKGVSWKNFHEINFVNIQYKPFNAAMDTPLPSGLLSCPKLREVIITP